MSNIDEEYFCRYWQWSFNFNCASKFLFVRKEQ